MPKFRPSIRAGLKTTTLQFGIGSIDYVSRYLRRHLFPRSCCQLVLTARYDLGPRTCGTVCQAACSTIYFSEGNGLEGAQREPVGNLKAPVIVFCDHPPVTIPGVQAVA